MIRRHYTFFGGVQGVGFRFRARYAAEAHGCTGWVRNESDGSVTMEIQGHAHAIDAVVDALEHGRFISIDSIRCAEVPVVGDERSFRTV